MKKFWSLIIVFSLTLNIVACSSDVKELAKDEITNEVKEEVTQEDSETTEESADKENDTSDPAKEVDELLFTDYIIENTDTTVTYINKFGKTTRVTKKPDRVVIAYNSILGLWYFAGGTSLTKVKGSTNVPEEAMDLFDLGSLGDLSLEAIIAQEPELVILAANYESQVAMAPILNEIGIETMIVDISINSYERFKENAYLFSLINDTQDIYVEKLIPINEAVEAIINEASTINESPKVAAIFASSKSIKLESEIAMVGEMVELLGGRNVIDQTDVPSGETRIAFSVEALISQNPEVIMISTMGSVDGVKENMEKMIAENPVWNEVDAVKNNRVFYLPKEYSVYKANELYAEAFETIAKILYPEIFGE